MTNLSVSDVLAEDFSAKDLVVTEKETKQILLDVEAARETATKTKKAKYPTMQSIYIYDSEILNVMKISDSDILKLIFNKSFYNSFMSALNLRNGFSWSMNDKFFSFIKSNASISRVVFLNSHISFLRDFIIMEGLMESSDLQNLVVSHKELTNTMHKSCIIHLFDLMDQNFASHFVDHPTSDLRKAAYRKLGILNSIEKMIADPDAEIRLLAARALPYNDSRHERFINDRSSKVFTVSLSKIEKSKLPLLLGSSHLKKPRIKSILSARMTS